MKRSGIKQPSQAQIDAREHNWAKALVKSSAVNMVYILRRDRRLNNRQAFDIKVIAELLNELLREWR